MNICEKLKNKKSKLAVVGLGYVGLPLAIEFGKKIPTIGFDVKDKRISELNQGIDLTHETSSEDLKSSNFIEFTTNPSKLKEAGFIIVAVPSPINKNKQPDLFYLSSASETVGKNLRKDTIVVFESTVYPGVTEDICVPIIEKFSGLKCGVDFSIGYSPERINPGDKEHDVTSIMKIVSGMDEKTLCEIAAVYDLVIKAGLYKAKSIKCAEAAKVIENVQRDLNIALINELSIIFHKLGIDTKSVLEAAETKWNFIKMQPGLVGGHCIGVDPYYLTHKAEEIGYNPQVILSGRRINDSMGKYIAEQTIKKLIEANKTVKGSNVLIMGITFKENVSDIRNSKVIDIITELQEYGVHTQVIDPLALPEDIKKEYGIDLVEYNPEIKADGIIIAVNHNEFKKILTIETMTNHLSGLDGNGVVMDIKSLFEPENFNQNNVLYWRL